MTYKAKTKTPKSDLLTNDMLHSVPVRLNLGPFDVLALDGGLMAERQSMWFQASSYAMDVGQ